MSARLLSLSPALLLAGCDLQALLADPKVVQKEADAKAIGSACRHGLRSLEDCYAMNEKASKSAIFNGWKEMDVYMRENKIDGIEPKGLNAAPVPKVAPDEEIVDEAKSEKKPDAKVTGKSDAATKTKAPKG